MEVKSLAMQLETACSSELSRQSYGAKYAVGGRTKRVFDVVSALLVLLLMLPLFFIVAVVLKVTDPAPVIQRHVRIGLRGRRFTCFKFRTIASDNTGAHRDQNYKFFKDPRVTAIGKLLRLSGLDELPQLFNVIRGDMSLVGPRPIAPSEMARYGDKLSLCLSARAGLTGAWQISDCNDRGYDQRVELDANYVCNWRFLTDLSILLRTGRAVAFQEGSY